MEMETWIQLGAYVLSLGIAVAVIKNDIRWMREWCKDHQAQDSASFNDLKEDIRDLRRGD